MVRQSPLVGRAAERAGLAEALAGCRNGTGGMVVVSGDAGAGKTRLVAEALSGWDGHVLRGAAAMGTGAYAPIVDVLRIATDRHGVDILHPYARILLPELGEPSRDADPAGLVAGVRRTLCDVARDAPTVVVLEDLHWAQAATVDMLPALAASLGGEPLLLIATYRGEELPRAHPVRAMRSELRRAGRLVEFPLGPLGRAETADLLCALLGATPSNDVVRALHERSAGLPFFVEELAGALAETDGLREENGVLVLATNAELPMPESVLDAVLVRTAPLRERYATAVEVAAVLGVRVDLPTLAGLVDPADVDRLLDANLLTEHSDDTAVFRHALARDALYRSIPWARRRAHHRKVAEQLTARGAAPEAIAEHWIAAHEHDRARPMLLAAAKRYCAVHAYRDAATLGRRALAIWPDGADQGGRLIALEGLADCAEMCGEFAAAITTWTDLAEARTAHGDVVGAAEAHRRIANAADMLGDWTATRAAREAAAEAFAAAGDQAAVATERLALAEQLESAGHLTGALDHVVVATEAADATGRADLKAIALTLQGSIRAALGEAERGVELARSGLAIALAEHPETAGRGHYDLAVALLCAADYAAAADAFESGVELCRIHGVDDLEQACVACMAVAVRLRGDWDRALTIAHQVLDDDRAPELVRMVAQEETGLITVLRGDRRRVRTLLRQAADFGRSSGVFGIEVGATWGVAVAADLDDDAAGARRTVSVLLERCQEIEDWVFALPALRWAVTFLAVRGDHDDLARCHRMIAAATTRNSSQKMLSILAHAGGELALAEGDARQAAAQLGRAVELLGGVTAPFEQALSQLRWGTALAKADDRTAAADKMTTAYRIARQLGAKPLARDCVTELAGMGERVDRRLGRLAARALEPAGLTRREKEVLRLLASGRTNRQIAQALFLSIRTVDMHVRNLLTKLDCSTRTAAVQRATELGLVPATAG